MEVERERERDEEKREQQISRVRDGVLGRNENSMGWKWPLVKKGHLCTSNKANQ